MTFEDMLQKQQEVAIDPNSYKDKKTFATDERFYTISKDESGNGNVTVRFLPSFNTNKDTLNTYLTYKIHSVNFEKKFPGKDKPEKKWTGELICPKTQGHDKDCPICSFAWDRYTEDKESGADEKVYKAWATNFLSKDVIVTNILIINDKVNPTNNGKVFLFKLSKTVLDIFSKEAEKIKEIIDSGDEAEIESNGLTGMKGFNPFDLLNGKNMTLKYKNKKEVSQPSDYWGSSYFATAMTGVVKNTDEYKEMVESSYCLDEFFTDEFITPIETLKKKLDDVTFGDYTSLIFDKEDEQPTKKPKVETKPALELEEPIVESKPELLLEDPIDEACVVEPKKEVQKPKSKSTSEMTEDEFFASLS